MKHFVTKVSLFLLLTVPVVVMAGWQVAKPKQSIPAEPFFQAGHQQQEASFSPAYGTSAFPDQFSHLGQPAAVYAVSVSGSLKENIERIMERYRWKVIWHAPYDYNFDGRVKGVSLPNVMEKLLTPFPLQTVLYVSNKTMIVMPRKV